jgi:CheY-like chemotaxis protein
MAMSAKRALIVDDSKSARAFLSRILEKYEVVVDTAESAEQAIDYLGEHRPDVIFMDHLMPGMDGFQALQSIKSNPRTAMIPIMMYTSQEGELYLGQARALGAIGVLPKQIKPADVSRVLYQLRILNERRGSEPQSSFLPANASAQAATRSASREPAETPHLRVVSSGPVASGNSDLRGLVESVFERHMGDLHRAVSAGLDAQSERLLGDVRVAVQDAIAERATVDDPDAALRASRSGKSVSRWGWALATVAALAAATFGALWWFEASEKRVLAGQLLTAKQETVALAEKLNLSLRAEQQSAIVLQDLQTQALVTTYAGRFCLQKAAEGFELALDSSLASRCDLVGNPFDESQSAALREPLAFANLAGTVRQQSNGAIRVQLTNGAADTTAMPYPASTDKLTAGEWNRAAAANNRIVIQIKPADARQTGN